MENEYILQSDLIDIVFEKRNKSYGAYIIRKFYNARLLKSLGITCSVALFACVIFSLGKKKGSLVIPDIETAPFHIAESPLEKPKTPEKPKIKPPVIRQQIKTQTWVKNIDITNEPVKTILPRNLDSLIIGSATITSGAGQPQVIQPVGAEDAGPAGNVPKELSAPSPGRVFETAEILPSFPGGMDALRKFLERNLQNPQDIEQGESVGVKIKFVVGFDGMLKGFETIEDGGHAFNNEVIRVLKKMPKWVPGKTKGENISVYYSIPVKFQGVEH